MYVGWFMHDETWAVPDFHPPSRIAVPKVREVLTASDFDSFDTVTSAQLADLLTPDGYLCIELTDTNDNELNAISKLVTRTSCDVLDRNFMVSSLKAQFGNRA